MKEQWRNVPGYEGVYEVSDQGRVRSKLRYEQCGGMVRLRRERILKAWVDRDGYASVRLSRDARTKQFRVSRLVLLAFVGDGGTLEAAHKNHKRLDNRLSNLEWATRLENEQQKDAAGRRPKAPWQILTPPKLRCARALRTKGHTYKAIGAQLGCHYSTVSLALRKANDKAF